MTLNDEIILLRDKLNESILNEEKYEVIYDLSTKLDTLIALYYRSQKNNKLKNKKVS